MSSRTAPAVVVNAMALGQRCGAVGCAARAVRRFAEPRLARLAGARLRSPTRAFRVFDGVYWESHKILFFIFFCHIIH